MLWEWDTRHYLQMQDRIFGTEERCEFSTLKSAMHCRKKSTLTNTVVKQKKIRKKKAMLK